MKLSSDPVSVLTLRLASEVKRFLDKSSEQSGEISVTLIRDLSVSFKPVIGY